MPIINSTDYSPPIPFRNKHLNTVYPALFRKLDPLPFERERFTTPDDDFLDVDWLRGGNRKLAILLHGLEGSSASSYISGLSQALLAQGWDIAVMNFRSCSGEVNLKLRSYHSGETEDLKFLISQARESGMYGELVLAGFSLGGNIVLKYVGEEAEFLPKEIKAALTFSVPCDLAGGEKAIGKLYTNMFLKTLIPKALEKIETHNVGFDRERIRKAKTIWEFDNIFTGPVHGFEGADDYYQQSSSLFYLEKIKVPTFLLSAIDDPFLSISCLPFQKAEAHKSFFLMAPRFGGHVGFVQFNKQKLYWSEQQALRFLEEKIG
ncbi:alpha/beta fold hydrolase [Flammeovirgaceae bacterium SG7u.111]|nr:alpha/beta fold hydrolase [Flammeovirgaceae bacterium SG7u.132]WPO36360.1 alpha/beta fold hydrolase [Flammeovirgaceae bacterium SG7u.111]